MIPQRWSITPVSTGGTTEEVVSLDEIKSALRLPSSTAEDDLLSRLAASGRLGLEREGNLSFVQKQFDMVFDRPPDGDTLKIPMSPLVSVDAVVAISSTGGETSLSSEVYTVDTYSRPGRLILLSGAAWPSPARDYSGFRVRFTAGFSTSASGVPDPLRTATLEYVAHLYEHRGDGDAKRPALIDELLGDFALPEAS